MMDAEVILDQSGRFRYSIQSDGTIGIVRCLENSPQLRIPEFLDGRRVTALLEESVDNDTFEAVFISKTVSRIENSAFLADHIREVFAAEENPWFQAVDGMLVDMEARSIVYCPPESSVSVLRVPSWIRSVGDFSFSSCVNLKQVIFPEGLESIGYEAFEHCEELTDIYIPSSVTHIGDWAFDDCPNLTLWVHKNVLRSIWGYFREFSDLNVELIEEEPPVFRTQGK